MKLPPRKKRVKPLPLVQQAWEIMPLEEGGEVFDLMEYNIDEPGKVLVVNKKLITMHEENT